MFFTLSKVLGFFVVPSNVMACLGLAGIALLAIGYVAAGRWMLMVSIVLVTAVAVLPIGDRLALPLESRFPRWDAMRGPPTGVIVLSGGVIRSERSTDREVVLGDAAERILAAAELARRYSNTRVVFTGGNPNLLARGPIEGDFVVRFFEGLGVSRDRVIIERKSRDTAENATFTKRLVMPKSDERWLLVTSAMHMPRAIGAFQMAGFTVDAYPVDYQTGNTEHPSTLFRALLNNIRKTNRAVHEWIGLLVYWMTGRISALFPGQMSEGNGFKPAPALRRESLTEPITLFSSCVIG